MDSSTLTVMLVIPAAALISSPLAYQCRCSALAYLPLRLALKVKALPMVAWPSALILTDALNSYPYGSYWSHRRST